MNKIDNNDIPVFKCDIRITDDGVCAKGELDGATVYSLSKMGIDEKVFTQFQEIMGKAMHEAGSLLMDKIQNMIKEGIPEEQEGLN